MALSLRSPPCTLAILFSLLSLCLPGRLALTPTVDLGAEDVNLTTVTVPTTTTTTRPVVVIKAQKTIPPKHVWAHDPFTLELKEIPRRDVPYGTTTWYREVEWQPGTWTPLGSSSKLDKTEDCQHTAYPLMQIEGCGANLLKFAEADIFLHYGRFLAQYNSTQYLLSFEVEVVVHEHRPVVVPIWYGTRIAEPSWNDHDYPTFLRFQCHALGLRPHSLPLFSEIQNPHEGDIVGYGANRTLLSGAGKIHVGSAYADPTTPTHFTVRCCVRGSVVGLSDDRCGDWVSVQLGSNVWAKPSFCPRFRGTYSLTRDRSQPAVSRSRCRHATVRLQSGRMKNPVCEGQTVIYRPVYTALSWYRQSLRSQNLNNLLPFEGDAGSSVGPHNLTIQHMSHHYAGWYMYRTDDIYQGEIFADLQMQPRLQVYLRLKRVDHHSVIVRCVSNLDRVPHLAMRVWWDIKGAVGQVTKIDARILRLDTSCLHKHLVLRYLFHIRCHVSTELQTASSDWFGGNGFKTVWEPADVAAGDWWRYF